MAYILNTFVKQDKKCSLALNDIFGCGKVLTQQICDQLGFSSEIKIRSLNANQIHGLTRCISQNYITGRELARLCTENKERLISCSSYRGFRYIEALPSRGQRTHGNAQTVRRCSERINTSTGTGKTIGKKRKTHSP